MITQGQAEDRLRDEMTVLVQSVEASPNDIADRVEARALQLRRRSRILIGAASILTVALVAIPGWLIEHAGWNDDPAQHVNTPGATQITASGSRRCQSLVDAPRSPYTRVIAVRVASGDQVRAWLRTRNHGAFSPSQIQRISPNAEYVVCGLRSVQLSPPGPPRPPTPSMAVSMILPPQGAPITDAIASPHAIIALLASLK